MTQSDMSDLERRDTCGTVFLANLRTLYLLLPYHNSDQIRLANPRDGSWRVFGGQPRSFSSQEDGPPVHRNFWYPQLTNLGPRRLT